MAPIKYPDLYDPDRLMQVWARNGYNGARTAREIGCDRGQVTHQIKRLGLEKPPARIVADLALLMLDERRVTVAPDWHVPLTDWAAVDEMVATARKLKATDALVVPGDFLNCDAWSRHPGPRQADAGASAERAAAKRAVRKILRTFDRLILTLGNHDQRLALALDDALTFCEAMELAVGDDARIQVTGRDACVLSSAEGPWRLCHTRSYSVDPCKVPAQLAERHQCHVVGAHRHHHGIVRTANGYWAVDGGCLADAERTDYLKVWTTKFADWQVGWTHIVDGVPYCPRLAPVPAQPQRKPK